MDNEPPNSVLAEQIKNLIRAIEKVEFVLNEIRTKYPTTTEVENLILIHKQEDDLRFEQIGNSVQAMQKIIW